MYYNGLSTRNQNSVRMKESTHLRKTVNMLRTSQKEREMKRKKRTCLWFMFVCFLVHFIQQFLKELKN